MNKRQWSRRIFVTIGGIGSGTTFLYIKQNIHDIEAMNYEGHHEEFDHPFVLLFLVYIGQMLIFSMFCVLNGPIRNKILQDLRQTWTTISSKCICCYRRHHRADKIILPNKQQAESQINSKDTTMQDENPILYVTISQPQGNTKSNQDIVHHNPVSINDNEEEGFIQLFVGGDQTLHLINYLPPAILMLLSTSFVYYAFGATYPATIIMFRAVSLGAIGIFRCKWMCNILRVQQSFSIRQWLAVLIMISAVIHSSYYDLITSKQDEQRNDISYVVTVPLLTIAHIGIALADTYDEKFLHDKKGIPLIRCFVESALGSIIYLIILPILYLIPDPLYPTTRGGVMENALNAFVQLYNNPTILYYVFGLIISEIIWMGARTFITKHSNAIVKTMIDSLQLVFIRYITPDLYTYSEQSEPTTIFTVVVFGLAIAVFYFSE